MRAIMDREQLVSMLSAKSEGKRIKAVKLLKRAEEDDSSLIPEVDMNGGTLSVHTYYSFSPYTPSLAAYMAYRSGLGCASVSDHDTLSGADEFTAAAAILGMESSAGLQLRARFYTGKGRWLNNFYERDIGFVAIRGIPERSWKSLNKRLEYIRKRRIARDARMVEKFNNRLRKYDISINFEKEVVPLSKYGEGGTVTERHILYTFAQKLIEKFGDAEAIKGFLTGELGINIEEEFLPAISDTANPYYAFDLLNCLKHETKFFYVNVDEMESIEDIVALAREFGGLCTYTYVGERHKFYENGVLVEKHEDEYLSEFISDLGRWGVDAIEYVPDAISEHKREQITELARENGMFTLPCMDINSPRQLFVQGKGLSEELSRNLWAVIGHAKSSQFDLSDGLNTEKSKEKNPNLEARLKLYAEIGKVSNV